MTTKKTYKCNGLLGWVQENYSKDTKDDTRATSVVHAYENCADEAEGFHTGQKVVFLDPITGLRQAGPVEVLTYDENGSNLVVSSPVMVKSGDAVYLFGAQTEAGPPVV